MPSAASVQCNYPHPASRASILYADDTLHRLDEKSEVEVVAPEAGSPGLLRVLSGRHYFASRRPKEFSRIETATAALARSGATEPAATLQRSLLDVLSARDVKSSVLDEVSERAARYESAVADEPD